MNGFNYRLIFPSKNQTNILINYRYTTMNGFMDVYNGLVEWFPDMFHEKDTISLIFRHYKTLVSILISITLTITIPIHGFISINFPCKPYPLVNVCITMERSTIFNV